MDGGFLAWIIPVAAIVGGAVGWMGRQYWHHREARIQAGNDARALLKDKRKLLFELLETEKDDDTKEQLNQALGDVNAALMGLHTASLRRTLKAANLPEE